MRRKEPSREPGVPFGAAGRLFEFESLPSTNTWALEHLAEARHGDVVWAHRQTAGRGRLGRSWQAAPDGSLTCSVILKDPDLVAFGPNLGQLAACAVLESLEAEGVAAKVKWPNDVMASDRKIAGVLVEQGEGQGNYVVGIGLNVNLSAADLSALDRPAVSLRMLTGRTHDVRALLEKVTQRFRVRVEEVAKAGLAPLREVWAGHDWLAGRKIRVTGVGGEMEGTYGGMDEIGRLRVLPASGAEELFWTGDVERVQAGD